MIYILVHKVLISTFLKKLEGFGNCNRDLLTDIMILKLHSKITIFTYKLTYILCQFLAYKLAIISTLEMLFPIQANDFEFMEFYN